MKGSLMKLNHVSTFSGEGQDQIYSICGIFKHYTFRKKRSSQKDKAEKNDFEIVRSNLE